MLVKFSTLANGVFIEDNGTDERKFSDRCFRFDANGNAEYALFADLTGSNLPCAGSATSSANVTSLSPDRERRNDPSSTPIGR